MQFGFYFDQSRCTGCYACVIACRDWHDITDTSVEIRKVIPLEQGKYPEVKLSYISLSCCHCETPVCKEVCPYDTPQFGEDDNSKMQMCSMCTDRLADHKNPVCVDACPMRALDFGPMDKLKEKYGKIKEVQGFTHSKETEPSIIFKPRY
jgi:anaerobic dimethyl sulfoxide reductase subunit B (iron-sulfur subunit)